MTDRNWFIVHTKPTREGEVNARLRDQGFETLLPLAHAKRRCGTRLVDTIRVAFPRYLFAGTEPQQSLRPINSTFGVSTVIYGNDGPAIVPHRVIDALRSRMHDIDDKGCGLLIDAAPSMWPRLGARARILDGPLAGFIGEIARLDSDGKCQVFLAMFRRAITANLSVEQIEAA